MIKQFDATIWGRDFSLPVDYDCFEDEVPSKEQLAAVETFINNLEWIDMAKEKVVKYCKNKVEEDSKNDKKDNIFSYIKPDYLFVKNEEMNTRIALMCKYKYDSEHGIAIVFANNGVISVGLQDIIL